MGRRKPLHLFEGYGLELEYMIVDRETLSVRPIVDAVLKAVAGRVVNEVEVGRLAWSNELVLHVIELKTNGPVASLLALEEAFQADVRRINRALAAENACLLSTGMHPLMDPRRETRTWPHAGRAVYETYNRVFGCSSHGWANLQSTHINLPFGNEEEFGRLHAALRLVLPILPALAASSPLMDGRPTGLCDTRLEVYRNNQALVPSITGQVIPEPVFTYADYRTEILQAIYRDIAPLDPEGILRNEWLNSRGVIARFQRNTLEIRILDVQECPLADVAIAMAVVCLVRAMVEERFLAYADQQRFPTARLARIFLQGIEAAERAVIDDEAYLRAFGFPRPTGRADELWHFLLGNLAESQREIEPYLPVLRTLLDSGCLARRITAALDGRHDAGRITAVYRQLSECLENGNLFLP